VVFILISHPVPGVHRRIRSPLVLVLMQTKVEHFKKIIVDSTFAQAG